MARKEQMLRLKYIENLLRRKKDVGADFAEIQDYLERKFAEKDLLEELRFTERTFLRDKQAIYEISGIEISYSRSRKKYFIDSEELEEYQEDIFDNLLLVEAYRESKNQRGIMIFEPRKSRGLENLHGLIHAIKNRKILTFTYQKFWNEEKRQRTVEPYALKEFEHRWYLLAKDHKPEKEQDLMKSFGLDRISDLDIKTSSFKRVAYDPKAEYHNSFGIISPDGEPQEIILHFDKHQGNYIKTMPLHHSQEILYEDENGIKIKLFLVPTYDFERAILSFGSRVNILEPKSFRNKIKQEVEELLENLKS